MAVLVGDDLPLVDLYLLGGYYYVKDGNHRVSVAKHRRMETIAAVVVEYLVDPPGAANHAAEAMCACAA
jgi:ParB-like chromosome segregation protein Spo0J